MREAHGLADLVAEGRDRHDQEHRGCVRASDRAGTDGSGRPPASPPPGLAPGRDGRRRRPLCRALVIGNTSDPETPYEGAVAMAGYLARAQLLTVDGYGHTVFLNPSMCAGNCMSRYFVDGMLPPPGTVCPQDHPPFTTSP
jgi:hypothetical protein